MNGLMKKSLLLRCFNLVILGAVSAVASAQISGAIYDTEITGTNVNQNQYEHCYEVYLNGGPQNQNANGLPLGDYYFMVTNPAGNVLLSADDVRNRRLKVTPDLNGKGRINGPVPDPTLPLVYPGHFSPANGGLTYPGWTPDQNTEAIPNAANGSQGVHLWPYYETPNNGGVYKIWLIPVEDYEPQHANNPAENFGFKAASQKTDTFGCVHDGGVIPPSSLIQGVKFYDADRDGNRDPDEAPIEGWEIRIVGTLDGQPVDYSTFTDEFGEFTAELDEGTTFEICEVIPDATPSWTQSHPSPNEFSAGNAAQADEDQCWTGTIGEDNILGLDFGNYRAADFSGVKFYDANVNGINDDGQFVVGVRINIFIDGILHDPDELGYTTLSGVNGAWEVEINLMDSGDHNFVVVEVLPGTSDPDCYWMQTAPALVDGARQYTLTEGADNLDFGNVCVCQPTNGRTLGFWSNRNGQDILRANDPAWRTLLNSLSLRRANGTDYDVPATSFSNAYGNFRTWLLNGTAVNMAYMLSVQLAASSLNVAYNGLDASDILWLTPSMAACYGSTTVTLGQVQADAQAALAADGLTLDGDPNRAHQECLKNILDASNNNSLLVIEGEPCDVIYP